MSARPWMPLYVRDYLANTAHLNAAQSGAYLHLIMHYWVNGELPTGDDQLTKIARMSKAEWTRARPILLAFFSDGWKHVRIEEELAKAEQLSVSRRANAQLRHSKGKATGPPLHTQSHTQLQKKEGRGADAPTPETEFFSKGKELLGEKAGGLLAKLLSSQNRDTTKALACLEAARGKQDPKEYIGGIIRGNPNGNALKAACDALIERADKFDGEREVSGGARENSDRLLPSGQ